MSSSALKVLHSNYELIECSRTQIANSLSISEFVCTQSFALNYGCTQTANILIISEFVCTQSLALKLRTHWVQPNSNCELIDYQWVRLHSKSRTQLPSKNGLIWICLFNHYQTPNPDWDYKRYFEHVDSPFHLLILPRTLQWFSRSWACFLSKYHKITLNFVENSINIRHFFVNLT